MYIREAHPADSNWADTKVVFNDPTTLAQRGLLSQTCRTELDLSLPTVVDDLQDTVNQRYRAWPERLYVIEKGGRIAYKGAMGPFGFKPNEARAALQELLQR